MAGAGVDDPVVPTQVLLRRSHLWADPITRHAVRVVCLVYDARGTAGAQDIAAGFCKSKNSCGKLKQKRVLTLGKCKGMPLGMFLTLALPLVLYIQVRVSFAFSL